VYKKITLVDMTGKTVMVLDVPVQSNDMKIDVSNLSKGVYCVKLQGEKCLDSKLVIR